MTLFALDMYLHICLQRQRIRNIAIVFGGLFFHWMNYFQFGPATYACSSSILCEIALSGS